MATTNPLSKILGERAPLPLLTHAQEISLARRVAAGSEAARRLEQRGRPASERRTLKERVTDGQAARETLILHNLPLVLSVAARFRYSTLDYDDLVQEGILGLIKAAEKYDPARGTRFGTLAVWWIRQAIGRAIANTGRTVRLPVNRGWKVGRLRRLAAQLAQERGAEPDLEQVAQAAEVSPQEAAQLLRDGQEIVSIDALTDPSDRSTLERLPDPASQDPASLVTQASLAEALEASLTQLEEREAQILRLRFGLDGGAARPLRAIAAEWRMSPEGIRQLAERALNRLRSLPRVRELGVYLEEG